MSTKVKGTTKKVKKNELTAAIVEAMSDRKAEDIVSLDLTGIQDAVADHFVICHATATTQVNSIAEHIVDEVKDKLNDRPWNKSGFKNCEWVLLDYVDVVVHVFLKDSRDFYQLEDLWSDAVRTNHDV